MARKARANIVATNKIRAFMLCNPMVRPADVARHLRVPVLRVYTARRGLGLQMVFIPKPRPAKNLKYYLNKFFGWLV